MNSCNARAKETLALGQTQLFALSPFDKLICYLKCIVCASENDSELSIIVCGSCGFEQLRKFRFIKCLLLKFR